MLVELTVKNFRSIREAQTLSLVAGKGDEMRHTHVTSSNAPATPDLLRAAVIYGANASGKSNFMRALMRLDQLVSGGSVLGDERRLENLYEPFRGDEESASEPTQFHVIFVEGGVRFDYWLAYNAERIVGETLYAFPEGRAQKWFDRTAANGVDEFSYGSSLRGPKKTWEAGVQRNVPFLTTAAAMRSEQLRAVHEWFNQRLGYFLNPLAIKEHWTAHNCFANDRMKKKVVELISKADLGIHNLHIEKISVDFDEMPAQLRENVRSLLMRKNGDEVIEVEEVYVEHKSDHGSTLTLKLSEESNGTSKLFALAGPWVNSLTVGSVLFIDELDTNLHPRMVRFLVSMFLDPDLNVGGAQLIFTTHNTNIMSMMRRDQVWLTEKGGDLATRMTPLSDFSPRKLENLERNYLDGRYGGLPFTGRVSLGEV